METYLLYDPAVSSTDELRQWLKKTKENDNLIAKRKYIQYVSFPSGP